MPWFVDVGMLYRRTDLAPRRCSSRFLFRTLDAFRVFDVVYVMTGGGPGTAAEPIALFTFSTLLQNLRFGYGSALSVIVFLVACGFALVTIRIFSGDAFLERRP